MSSRVKKVFVALSGGVDSSVAAALLKAGSCPEPGRRVDVVGCHIKCYNIDGCGEKDAEDARRVAEQLNIPFYVFDLEKEYKERVVKYMIDGYRRGITPNPDVMCNKEIKFGLFLKKSLTLGADYIATGHYVRLQRPALLSEGSSRRHQKHGLFATTKSFDAERAGGLAPFSRAGFGAVRRWAQAPPFPEGNKAGRLSLYIAKDKNKDQSYFLWTLTQEQLKYCLFPIGEYTKPQVRKLAKKFGLLTAKKKDSQGICFLGKVNVIDFLKKYISQKRGVVLNTAGQKIGEHQGAYFYTIGQRRGLKIGGIAQSLYVTKKNIKANTIIVAEGKNHPALYKKEVLLGNVNFIQKSPPPDAIASSSGVITVWARVRYRQPPTQAVLRQMANGKWQMIFARPQKFIAPGQSAVFYSKQGELLGGGIIS